jgi:DNA-binding NtrC family response regulator
MSQKSLRILIVDDEELMREVLRMRLENWGYEVVSAANGSEGRQSVERLPPDIVISDVVMPDISGLALLKSLKSGDPARTVLLMTAHGTVDMAVEAIKAGAKDFITKPLDYAKLRLLLRSIERERADLAKTQDLSQELKRKARFGEFVGTSQPMRQVYELIQAMADSDVSVLITGESGTGKELAARVLHQRSRRNEGPFVAVNASAVPRELMESEVFGHEKGAFTGALDTRAGCFELAHGGTLFLDEIGEMPVELQPKLLRVLEDGRIRRLGGSREFEFNVRTLAATNRDPGEAVTSGDLRKDLLYRINVFNIQLPPLRQRTEDIPLLVEHFREKLNQKHEASIIGVRQQVLDALEEYSWPGNVRELKNVVERAVVLARDQWIEVNHLPPYLLNPIGRLEQPTFAFPEGVTAAEAEKALILKTLERTHNNKAKAARLLGLDVKTVRNKLKSYRRD